MTRAKRAVGALIAAATVLALTSRTHVHLVCVADGREVPCPGAVDLPPQANHWDWSSGSLRLWAAGVAVVGLVLAAAYVRDHNKFA